ncbi:MAG: restriction endonuclease [Bacilli bacterium]
MKIINYDSNQFEDYKVNLNLVGSLSLLFSESEDPWLDYRVPENLYCECFGAENLARSCVTADAKLGTTGIGIKTFTEGNKKTWQKIAEFNKARKTYKDLMGIEKVKKIAELRNDRIDSTISIYGLEKMIYHCVIRNKNGFHFYEEEMVKIVIDNIVLVSDTDTSIIFKDGIHEYNFNLSKSVLQKRFYTEDYFDNMSIKVAKNPFDVLRNGIGSIITITENETAIIPLYSVTGGVKTVYPKSGLNQWNAGGRERSINEVYIPYNKEIREKYEEFFPDRDTPFDVVLPNGRKMSMKLCQNERTLAPKALMSNPNGELGAWILREVLRLEENEVLTYEKLAEIGIESVLFEKDADGFYKLDFMKIDEELENKD